MQSMLINGEAREASSGARIEVSDPANLEILDSVPAAGAEDVNRAVEAAGRAFLGWSALVANERASMLHEIGVRMREHQAALIDLLTREEGKPRVENEEEVEWSANTFDYYAELGRHEVGQVLPPGASSQFNFTLKEPYGVVACITPWNYPIMLLAWKLAPALAAGNTCVVKPSELTPLSSLYFAEHCLSHLPPGVVNVVTGTGLDAGEPLVAHPSVAAIAFTGSLETGQRIASLAAPQMKKLHLELGGKDPMVIAEDAEPEKAARALAYSSLLNCGQVCTSTERVYLPRARAEEFTEALVEHVRSLRLGHGLDAGTDIGPMIEERFRAKVEAQVAEATAQGAKLLVGGRRPEASLAGAFYEPAVLTGVDHSMRIMREETFGPAIPLMEYEDFDQAVALANDSPFGLGASLLSSDPDRIKRFFQGVRAGTIWINDPLTDNYAGPFGGMRLSGGSRELGQEGLDEFRTTKHVHWDFSTEPKDFWYPYD
ncbi:MAG: aldehyde dehydrogenase family protein [Myxococcota bacterium]|jgi:acyl-CoA reductase-like NAD-dependent aldehyde dehydrogenase|nr:aldehyde dehydrogenase family protein [Myxococcota bacterium]